MQILVNHRVSHVMSHVTRIPSSNQDRIQDMIQRWENESETNCIMKFSFLKCSKNRTWRKLLIWTWSRKIKFLHFVKLLFSQQAIVNKNFDLSAVFWCFFSGKWARSNQRFPGSPWNQEFLWLSEWIATHHISQPIKQSGNQLKYFYSW